MLFWVSKTQGSVGVLARSLSVSSAAPCSSPVVKYQRLRRSTNPTGGQGIPEPLSPARQASHVPDQPEWRSPCFLSKSRPPSATTGGCSCCEASPPSYSGCSS